MCHPMYITIRRITTILACMSLVVFFLIPDTGWGETKLIAIKSSNRPLPSLFHAAEAARAKSPVFQKGALVHVPNFLGSTRTQVGGIHGPDQALQEFNGTNVVSTNTGFEGTSNEDQLSILGFRVAPPDTNGDVGPNHFVQMINLTTTIFNKSGSIVQGPFPSNAIWSGMGGNCEPFNQGDPVVVYDETNGRWIFTQFAFSDDFSTYSLCVAVSNQNNAGPLDAFNRYEFNFDVIGFPDYPKFGVVTDSLTVTANLFLPPVFFFNGTLVGAMDKLAMYNGDAQVWLLYGNQGILEFGYLPGDLDAPSGTNDPVPALFATAMSRTNLFDIWELFVNWNLPDPTTTATLTRIAGIGISPFDSDLCGASREACIEQPNHGPALEALSDRLMHRLQIRDFNGQRRMVTAHTVDADGNGTAGIRWYEMRQDSSSSSWYKYQEGTYAPGDGLNRWMPSIAMNAGGDIGMGFLVSSLTEPMGIRLTGQTAGSSGSGMMDAAEHICRPGQTEQTGTARSGDYSATTVDPVTDTFWHTNEYGQRNDKSAGWGTFVCEFEVASSNCTPTETTEVSCNDGIDNDCDNAVDCVDIDCASACQADCSTIINKSSCNATPGCEWHGHPRTGTCEVAGACTPTETTEVSCNDGIDNDCDSLTDSDDPDCSPNSCDLGQKGDSCTANSDCCSDNCKGKSGSKTCK